MAVTLTEIDRQFLGGQMVKTVDITWDSSYASGGESLSLTDLGMSRIDEIECDEGASSAGAYITKWDGSKTAPKILVYSPGSQALTDSSGGTAAATLAAGVGKYYLYHPLTSLATGLSTSAIDIMTDFTISHKFKILTFDFVTTVAGTGAGASQTFNIEIGSTDLTGGSLNVTLASTDTIGKVTAGTAITAANTGAAAATISIEMAASGTVFTAGAGYFQIGIQNMDTADAFASLVASASGSEVLASTTNLASPQMTSRIRVRGA